MLIQEAFAEYDFQDVAVLVRLFTKIAELVLRTPQGVVRYLMGAPLYYNTTHAAGVDPPCPGITDEGFFPTMLLPYMPRVLGISDIELCAPDVRSRIKVAVARNSQLAARVDQLTEEGATYVKESLQNTRCRTVLQAPRIKKHEEPQRTTSILQGRAGERPLRHPHFSDDPEVHSPVAGSPQSIYFPLDGDQLTSPGGPETEMGSEAYKPRFQEQGEGGSETSGPSRSTTVGGVGGGPTPPNDYVPPVQVSPAQAAPDVDVDDVADAPPVSELDRAIAEQRERERLREMMGELDAVRRRRQDADDAGKPTIYNDATDANHAAATHFTDTCHATATAAT
jgi:hypothetical protein